MRYNIFKYGLLAGWLAFIIAFAVIYGLKAAGMCFVASVIYASFAALVSREENEGADE